MKIACPPEILLTVLMSIQIYYVLALHNTDKPYIYRRKSHLE